MAEMTLRALTLRLAAQRPDLRSAIVQALDGLTLRERAVLLASDNPRIRREVLAAVRAANNTSVIQQAPIVIQQPPIIVQQTTAPAEPAAPQAPGVLFVTERTQKGFEADLLPEMERLLSQGVSRQQVGAQITALLQQSFAAKDHLYNILIRHQSTFESDPDYLQGLERLVQAWVNNTASPGG